MYLSSKELSVWLLSLSPKCRKRYLVQSDAGRVFSLFAFDRWAKQARPSAGKIGVLSGSLAEPELDFLGQVGDVTLLNFEQDSGLFDLTLDWGDAKWSGLHEKFDLVFCEQVLEHLPDPQRAFQNLSLITAPGGFIHVSTPAINNTHGEPYFYFSGFHPRALAHFATKAGLGVVEADGWASNKASRMGATCDWAPISESGPLRFFIMGVSLLFAEPKKILKIIRNRVRIGWRNPLDSLLKKPEYDNFAISWVIAGKKGRAA